MAIILPRLCRIVLLLLAFQALAAISLAAPPQSIRVVMDDNYPPYVFHGDDGKLQGILIDQWRLWEQKTGIRAEVTAIDWGKALDRMHAGEFDVIDTIFHTEDRAAWLDFGKPYATLEVPIFFRRDITGISGAASLKGFAVAAKRGDDAVDVLRKNGVENLLLFDSYEGIVLAARDHRVNVFAVAKAPALYLLFKLGIQEEFRFSAPLNVGQFHRAVARGRGGTSPGGGTGL